MKKASVPALVVAVFCTGCTTLSLEIHTLNQIDSGQDYRLKAALNCLAAIAADPDTLPSFALLGNGTTRIQDTANLSATTLWTRAVASFSTETLAAMASRSPQEAWTINPVADYTQLEAMRCSCQWVIYGRNVACSAAAGILNSPEHDHSPGPHFGVVDRLARLPTGWLHIGGPRDVPAASCYKAHCGHTWVWVMPDGMEGLADFTLVLLDIATIDVGHAANTSPPVLVTLELHERICKATAEERAKQRGAEDKTEKPPTPKTSEKLDFKTSDQLVYNQVRVVKPECKHWIEQQIWEGMCSQNQIVQISWDQWMACTDPYHGTRASITPTTGLGLATRPALERLLTQPSGPLFNRPLYTEPSGPLFMKP